MSDFVQDVSERDALSAHLLEMFGERGERTPEWDRERKYVPSRMQLYVTHQGDDDAERTVPLSADRPLGAQLLALQSSGYVVPGIPIVQVVIKGSAYEKEFRKRTGRAG